MVGNTLRFLSFFVRCGGKVPGFLARPQEQGVMADGISRSRLGGFQPHVCPVLFRDSKQNQIHQPARPYNVDLSETMIFWNIEKKGRDFASRIRFSESTRSIFSPRGYRIKELWKKDGPSMKNVKGP